MRLPIRGEFGVRIGLLLVAALFVLAYSNTLVKLFRYWAANDMYSYAFLVPLISVFLVWGQRGELRKMAFSPSMIPGTLVTAAGLMMLVVGRASATNLMQEMSLVVTVAGLTLLLLGRYAFRRLFFPIAYLLAMIPFWEVLTSRLHPYFQLYSASVGVGLLRLFDVPVFKEGFIIQLPNINLMVAEACSGINYLIAVLCIGIPLTSLYVKSWSRRLIIVLVATLIALLSNGLRVAIIALLAYHDIRGPNGDVHGPFALFRSLLISGIGYVALFALIHLFAEKERPRFPLSSRAEGQL